MTARRIVNAVLALVVLGAAGGAAVLLVASRTPPEQQPAPKVVPKVVAPPIEPVAADYRVQLVGFGSARPADRVRVAPQVSGHLTYVAPEFDNGLFAKQDQVLLRIDTTDYEQAWWLALSRMEEIDAQLANLEREATNLAESLRIEDERLALANEERTRAEELFRRNVASESELDAAREQQLARRLQVRTLRNQLALIDPRRRQLEAARLSALTELDKADTALQRCVVRSPLTGRVLSKSVEVNDLVVANAVCGEVYGLARMEVPVSVPAEDLNWVEPDLLEACRKGRIDEQRRIEATVEWPATGGRQGERLNVKQWDGCVRRVEAGLEEQTRTAVLVVCVQNPPADTGFATDGAPLEDLLDLNMYCRVMVRGRRAPGAFLLPRRAIQPGPAVYVIERDAEDQDRLVVREVRVARYTDDQALVLPGGALQPGDRVITSVLPKAIPGMRVDVVNPGGAADRETPSTASSPNGT